MKVGRIFFILLAVITLHLIRDASGISSKIKEKRKMVLIEDREKDRLKKSDLGNRRRSAVVFNPKSWEKMQSIQGLLSKNRSIGLMLRKGLITQDDVRDWRTLKRLMKNMHLRETTSTFFNVAPSLWTTCAMFAQSYGNNAKQIVFCGSHKALDLPVPCRDAEEGVDFDHDAMATGYFHEEPSAMNTGIFSCDGHLVTYDDRQAVSGKIEQVKMRVALDQPRLSTISVREDDDDDEKDDDDDEFDDDEFGDENWVVSVYSSSDCPSDTSYLYYPCYSSCWYVRAAGKLRACCDPLRR